MTRKHIDRHQLSSAGSERQTRMLAELKTEVSERARQKGHRRTLFWVWGAAGILIAASVLAINLRPEAPSVAVEENHKTENTIASSAPQYDHVTLETISDEELLSALAALGQPSVLGQIGGETMVVSQGKP